MDDTTNQAAMPTDPTPTPTPTPDPTPTPTPDPTPNPTPTGGMPTDSGATDDTSAPAQQPGADLSDVKLPGEATPEPDTTV